MKPFALMQNTVKQVELGTSEWQGHVYETFSNIKSLPICMSYSCTTLKFHKDCLPNITFRFRKTPRPETFRYPCCYMDLYHKHCCYMDLYHNHCCYMDLYHKHCCYMDLYHKHCCYIALVCFCQFWFRSTIVVFRSHGRSCVRDDIYWNYSRCSWFAGI